MPVMRRQGSRSSGTVSRPSVFHAGHISRTLQEPQTERREHQDDPDVYYQPLPELVPEEQDVHSDHDGYQREHVKYDGCPSSHRSCLLCATEWSKSGAGFNEHLRGMSCRCFARRWPTPSMSCSEREVSGFGSGKGPLMIASGLWAGMLGGARTPNLLIRSLVPDVQRVCRSPSKQVRVHLVSGRHAEVWR